MKRAFVNAGTAFLCLLLISCLPTSATPSIVLLQYTPAVQPWLGKIEGCADGLIITADMRSSAFFDLSKADMAIRLGSEAVSSDAYQIGSEKILIIVNENNPVTKLSQYQVTVLFSGAARNWSEAGGENAPVKVWVYPAEDEVFQAFESAFAWIPTSPEAHVAADGSAMLTAIMADPQAIGMATENSLTAGVRAVYEVTELPVLVLLPNEPAPSAVELLNCLQR